MTNKNLSATAFRFSKTQLKWYFFFFLIFSFFIAVQCTKKQDDTKESNSVRPISLGFFTAQTGRLSSFGRSNLRGAKLAVKHVNQSGGIHGRPLELIVKDTQGRTNETKKVVQDLIKNHKVPILVGEVSSELSLVAAPIAQSNKVVMISPASTSPRITDAGSFIFRTCYEDPFQGFVMAKFAVENLKLKKVAVLKDSQSEYSQGLADFFIKTFTDMGGEVILDENYKAGDIDFRDQLKQIRSRKPEAIFLPGYYTEVGLIARQISELGIEATLLGGDGWDSSRLFELGREAINGGYFSNHFSTQIDSQKAKDFVFAYSKKYGQEPNSLAALAYDTILVLAKALKNSKDPDNPASIQKSLTRLSNFHGVTGSLSMNQDSRSTKSAYVVKVSGPKNQFVTEISGVPKKELAPSTETPASPQ